MKTRTAITLFSFAVMLTSGCTHHCNRGYDSKDPACAKEAGGVAWHHPTKTAADFRKEETSCRSGAWAKAEKENMPGNPFMIADETRRCLEKEYGWLQGCD
ncbi:MAG TPA: hypothetical protein VI389_00135 [Geobacteraceae bacterium]